MKLNSDHVKVMEELKGAHAPLVELIGGRPIHYLDLPLHGNVGDLLIMLGTERFLAAQGLPVVQRAFLNNFVDKVVRPGDVILLHGGGNFGDIYPSHQLFRERVVTRFPDNTIIVLPQTLYFSNQERLSKSLRLFADHPDCHICVRDAASYEKATVHLSQSRVYLMPDMAHQLYRIPGADCRAVKEMLVLKRSDCESSEESPFSEGDLLDWSDILGFRERIIGLVRRAVRSQSALFPSLYLTNLWASFWVMWCRHLANLAVKTFSDHRSIETDRMHGHILACLLDRHHTVGDNSYGKNFSYIQQWTRSSPLVSMVPVSRGSKSSPTRMIKCDSLPNAK